MIPRYFVLLLELFNVRYLVPPSKECHFSLYRHPLSEPSRLSTLRQIINGVKKHTRCQHYYALRQPPLLLIFSRRFLRHRLGLRPRAHFLFVYSSVGMDPGKCKSTCTVSTTHLPLFFANVSSFLHSKDVVCPLEVNPINLAAFDVCSSYSKKPLQLCLFTALIVFWKFIASLQFIQVSELFSRYAFPSSEGTVRLL